MTRFIAPLGVLILAGTIAAGGLVANAKEPAARRADAASSGTIGLIDMEEVYNASGAPQELEQAARQHEAQGVERIKQIMAVPYLEPKELEDYGTLIGKAKLTPEEEKQAEKFRSTNEMRVNELKTLQTKPDNQLNADDRARMSHLVELKQALQTQVRPGLVDDFRTQHEGWLADFRHHQLVTLRQEVAKVAKEKGIDHVFDSTTLIYSVNDLTPTVLQRISRKTRRGGGQ